MVFKEQITFVAHSITSRRTVFEANARLHTAGTRDDKRLRVARDVEQFRPKSQRNISKIWCNRYIIRFQCDGMNFSSVLLLGTTIHRRRRFIPDKITRRKVFVHTFVPVAVCVCASARWNGNVMKLIILLVMLSHEQFHLAARMRGHNKTIRERAAFARFFVFELRLLRKIKGVREQTSWTNTRHLKHYRQLAPRLLFPPRFIGLQRCECTTLFN